MPRSIKLRRQLSTCRHFRSDQRRMSTMGLDIRAYNRLKLRPDINSNEWEHLDYRKFVQISAQEIEWSQGFGERAGQLQPGTYEFEKSYGFRAGSYSGYGAFRNWLAKLAGYGSAEAFWNGKATEGPFVELINFADNEGVFDACTSAKLAKDFANGDARAKASTGLEVIYYYGLYQQWRQALELAADGGCLRFR